MATNPVVPDQVVELHGKLLTLRWHPLPLQPAADAVTQASGICLTSDGMVVLVNGRADPYWTLPGGHPEGDETPRDALIREVAEEACARVIDCEYIGSQEVIGERPSPHFQTRFWALVELDPWEPRFEMTDRRLVQPDEFTRTLAWGSAPTAGELLRLACGVHQRRGYAIRE